MESRGRTTQSQHSSIFLLLGISVGLFLFDRVGVLSLAHGFSDLFFNPVKHSISDTTAGFRDYVTVASSYPQLQRDVANVRLLQKKVLELTQKTGELSQENKKLREMLEAPVPSEWKLLPAPVLGVSGNLMIGMGKDDGVATGMTVVDARYYVGKIISLQNKSAHVQLPFDADSEVLVSSTRGTRGIVKGSFGETIELTQVLQSDPLFLGDEILTTGEDGLGRGLFVGKVKSIEAADTEPYKSAVLTPLVDFHILSTVFVVLDQ